VIIFSLLHQLARMEGPGCISSTWLICWCQGVCLWRHQK